MNVIRFRNVSEIPCERNTFSETFQTKTFYPKRIRKHITCERSMSIRNRIQTNAGFLCCRPVCYSDSHPM